MLSDLSDILKSSSDRLGKGVYIGTKKVELLYFRILEKTPGIYRRIVSAFPTMRTKYEEQLRAIREKDAKKAKGKSESIETEIGLPAETASRDVDTEEATIPLTVEETVSPDAVKEETASPVFSVDETTSPLPETPIVPDNNETR